MLATRALVTRASGCSLERPSLGGLKREALKDKENIKPGAGRQLIEIPLGPHTELERANLPIGTKLQFAATGDSASNYTLGSRTG